MFDVFFATISILLCFTLIGFGPTLFFFKTEESLEVCLALAPAVGIVITTIFGTYLVLLNYPVINWASLFLGISFAGSLLMSVVVAKRKNIVLQNYNKPVLWLLLIGYLLTIILVLSPMLIKGLDFTVLRGNGTDDFNYLTMAGYLLHEPYAWIFHATTQSIINLNPTYELARELLTTRWSTSMLLAWCAAITHVPIYRLDYGFTAVFLIAAYGVAFVFAQMLRVNSSIIFLVAVAICVGFWGQFVLDARAMSQISAIPLLLLLCFMLAKIESDTRDSMAVWGQILLGLTFTALVFLYVEMIPMVLLGLVFFILIQLLHRNTSVHSVFRYVLTVIVVIISMLPAANYLLKFFAHQAVYALQGKNNWQDSFFPWLYSKPIIGFWGEACLRTHHYLDAIITPALYILALLLSLIFIAAIIYTLFNRRNSFAALNIAVSFMLAAFVMFLGLIWRGQLWAAAKGLSYGYPFIYFIVAATIPIFAAELNKFLSLRNKNIILIIGKYTIIIWLVIQCLLGMYRIVFAANNLEYQRYIGNHGDYKQHDWNLNNFVSFFQKNKCTVLGLVVKNSWYAQYLEFAFSWEMQVINLYGIYNQEGKLVGTQKLSQSPQYLLVDKNASVIQGINILAQNKDLMLIKYTHQYSKLFLKAKSRMIK